MNLSPFMAPQDAICPWSVWAYTIHYRCIRDKGFLISCTVEPVNETTASIADETYTFRKWAGFGTLGSKIIKLFLDESQGAMGVAKLLTGHEHERNAIHRIDHSVPLNAFKMDDSQVIQELKGLGYSFARDRQPVLQPVFFTAPAETFPPIYTHEQSVSNTEEVPTYDR